jgi:hypothetical protein
MKDYQIIENIELDEIENKNESFINIDFKKKDKTYYLHKVISSLLVSSILIPNIYLFYIML